ncbi:hypothetical protein DPMN_102448 [Dreissena polymorpha]|uniref:Uncharacterized protein n=1 Tax=Dreissena polymorpha TaxID=45954 RepID=A0A9D4LKD3_DREPO|nr:hypothetical protein DPMN_102448 [Dreissena polymorpha]
MSLAEDQDFGASVIDNCSKIIGSEVGKVINQLRAEKQERNKLQQRVTTLEAELQQMKNTIQELKENQKRPCDCQQILVGAFNAALKIVSPPKGDSHSNNDFLLTAEAIMRSPVKKADTFQPSARKRVRAKETSQIFLHLEDLPDDIAQKIKPYYKEDSQATQDLLNLVQRAFVKYTAAQLQATNERMSQKLIDRIISEGIQQRIWTSDFCPTEKTNFETYLVQRLKNEKKALKRRESIEFQQERVHQYLQESINAEVEDEDEQDN